MERERLAQRILWAMTAVLIVAGILSAAIVGADDDGDDLVTSSGSPATTMQAGSPGNLDAATGGDTGATTTPAPRSPGAPPQGGGSPRATAPGNTTPQAQPQSPSQPQQSQGDFRDLGAVDDAGATQVPAAGTYAYRLTDDSGEAHDASTIVEDKGTTATGARRMVLTFRGESVDLVHDALWGPDQLRYAKTTFTYGGSQFECDWQPDYVVMPLVLSRGTSWDAKSSCTVQAGATTAVLNRTTTSKVTDARRVHVAGGEVLVWVIDSNDRLEFPGQGAIDTKETTWFAPKLGLVVRQVVETSGSDPEDSGKTEMVIKRLTPS